MFSLDLTTSKQTELNLNLANLSIISPEGRQVAWTRPEGDTYGISVGAVGSPLEAARTLSRDCGRAISFTPDSRYLICQPESRVKANPKQKYSTALLEVASGEVIPWLQDATESVTVGGFVAGDRAIITTERPGEAATRRNWLARWRPEPIPRSEWIEFKPHLKDWNYSLTTLFIYGFQDSGLMAIRFDVKQGRMSEPFPVRLVSGSPTELRPSDTWFVRGSGIAFARRQTSGSVWLMKLP